MSSTSLFVYCLYVFSHAMKLEALYTHLFLNLLSNNFWAHETQIICMAGFQEKGRDRDHWVRLMTSTRWAQIKMSTSNTADKALIEGHSAAPLGKTRDRPDKAQSRSENKHLTVRNPRILVFTTGISVKSAEDKSVEGFS